MKWKLSVLPKKQNDIEYIILNRSFTYLVGLECSSFILRDWKTTTLGNFFSHRIFGNVFSNVQATRLKKVKPITKIYKVLLFLIKRKQMHICLMVVSSTIFQCYEWDQYKLIKTWCEMFLNDYYFSTWPKNLTNLVDIFIIVKLV